MSAQSAAGKAPLVRIISTARLSEAGYSPAAIRTRLKRGDLVRVGRGFYATRKTAGQVLRHPDGERLFAVAVGLAGLGRAAAASHDTAAVMHNLDLMDRPGPEVTMTRRPGGGSRVARPGINLKVAALPAAHVTAKYGLRVTTPARTVIDVARTSPFQAGVVIADSALRTKQTTKDELRGVLATCRRWRGVAGAAEVVEFADNLSESALESIARVAFRDCGLPPPQLQASVGGDEMIGRADFFWKQFRTIAEADGALKYADPDRARQQLRRDAKLRAAGFEVVHFSWWEITQVPENVAASIRAAFARGAFAQPPSRPELPAEPASRCPAPGRRSGPTVSHPGG